MVDSPPSPSSSSAHGRSRPYTLTIVAAIAENRTIGRDGEMPWHYPEDLRRFKRLTLGHPVIMGRVTFESIVSRLGHPLPGRTNVVLTRSPEKLEEALSLEDGEDHLDGDGSYPTAVEIVTSIEAALDAAYRPKDDEVFVAGGQRVYEQFLPMADRMQLTLIHDEYEGDAVFPEWSDDEWVERSREDHGEFSFVHLERDTSLASLETSK